VEDPEKVLEQVGRRIAELRAKAGQTQAQVAERLGTTVSNYQRMEHGLQNLTIRTLVKIAGAIGTKTAALFERPTSKAGARGRPRAHPR
jgi:transcriptional regulator with XRE-family HTH domain